VRRRGDLLVWKFRLEGLPLPVPSGGSRVASYNGTDSAKESGGEEGSKRFLGGVRRLSFGPAAVWRHSRGKSQGSTMDPAFINRV
jgi:hypothetical protein